MDPDLYPELGVNTALAWHEMLPHFPNVNVYEALAVVTTTIARLDVAAESIAQTNEADIIGGEQGRQEALDRMGNVRVRLAEVWGPMLQERIAALGSTETCASLQEPGSGLLTWLFQPRLANPEGILMDGDWQAFGITEPQATSHFTPEYAAPDAYLAGYLADDTLAQQDALYAAEDLIAAVLEVEGPIALAYICKDPVVQQPPTEKPLKKFPWWLLGLAALGFTVRKK